MNKLRLSLIRAFDARHALSFKKGRSELG